MNNNQRKHLLSRLGIFFLATFSVISLLFGSFVSDSAPIETVHADDSEYEDKIFTVHFDSDGGSEIEDQHVTAGDQIDLLNFIPTRKGYDFVEWWLSNSDIYDRENAYDIYYAYGNDRGRKNNEFNPMTFYAHHNNLKDYYFKAIWAPHDPTISLNIKQVVDKNSTHQNEPVTYQISLLHRDEFIKDISTVTLTGNEEKTVTIKEDPYLQDIIKSQEIIALSNITFKIDPKTPDYYINRDGASYRYSSVIESATNSTAESKEDDYFYISGYSERLERYYLNDENQSVQDFNFDGFNNRSNPNGSMTCTFYMDANKPDKPELPEEPESPKPTQKPTPKPGAEKTVTMYRAYNPNSGEHFYTKNKKEFDHIVSLGWNNEGVGWIAPQKSNTPVYRLYNANGGEHHYTTNVNEKNALLKAGWKDEGIGWYSDDEKRTPLYRQYNPNAFANNHNYTTSRQENDYLVSLGWKAEGIGWYGVRAN